LFTYRNIFSLIVACVCAIIIISRFLFKKRKLGKEKRSKISRQNDEALKKARQRKTFPNYVRQYDEALNKKRGKEKRSKMFLSKMLKHYTKTFVKQ